MPTMLKASASLNLTWLPLPGAPVLGRGRKKGGSKAQGHIQLPIQFEASLGYMRPYLKGRVSAGGKPHKRVDQRLIPPKTHCAIVTQ